MKNLSRYILIAIAVLSFMVALPGLYWLAFEKPISAPFIMYSCIDDDFVSIHDGVRMDRKGNELTLDEYEQKLPLLNMRQLLMSGTMPDTIKGVEMDPQEVNLHRSFFRFKPATMHAPKPGLYPMIESESGRAQLEMPKDFFRISGRMEFVDAASNEVNEEKTIMFTAVLQKNGFRFPAKMIEGIPTTRKSCDEGYLVIDDNDALFHVKMIEGKPYVYKVDLPEGMKFSYINCVDFKDRKYYAYLFTTTNELYILTQDDYELVRWSVDNLNPPTEEIRIYGDLFNYNVISTGENYMNVTILDKNYARVTEYNETWESREESKQGRIFSLLFPAQISLTDDNSSFRNLYMAVSPGFAWLILNLVLVAGQFVIYYRRKLKNRSRYFDMAIIALTGIYGFIAVNFFPNK
ncbi:MAG: DUF4857 domain-containing protein [Bacteroidota bacterium]